MGHDRLYYAWVLPAGASGRPGEAYAALIPGEPETRALGGILASLREAALISSWGVMPADQCEAPEGERLVIQTAGQFLTAIVNSKRFGLASAPVMKVTGVPVPTGALGSRFGR